ncbi:MAG: hypothetical protein AB7K67_01475 [Hyphomicrobiaceae bacterium]|jgi:hypothetical protein
MIVTAWMLAQYVSPFIFAAIVLWVGLFGGAILDPQSIVSAVKLISWMDVICVAYMFIQGLTAITQPAGKYAGRAWDIAFSVVPLIALVAVMTAFFFGNIELNLVQRKFLWMSGWAIAFDMILCTLIAFRISMRAVNWDSSN